MSKDRRRIVESRTEVEEENVRHVRATVVTTIDEQVRANLRSRMREPFVALSQLDQLPQESICRKSVRIYVRRLTLTLTKVEAPDVREALPPVAAADDNHDVADQVRCVISSRGRLLPPRLHQFPP